MKKLLCFMAMTWMFLSLFTFCSEDKEEEPVPVPATLKVEGSPISVEAPASTASFTVLSNKDWTAETEVAWLTFTPSSGKADSKLSVEVTISANAETVSRSGVITIKAGDKREDVKIEQKGKVIIPGIEIADPKFKHYLLENFDANEDGEISTEEAEVVTRIDCSGKEIESLGGIEHFVNLDTLLCNSNALTKVGLGKNTNLTFLSCNNNQIDSLGISENTQLKSLDCSSNKLEKIDLTGNMNLTDLNCSSNLLAGIDVNKNLLLTTLICSDNVLTALDVSNNAGLKTLNCSGNQLAILDLSRNAAIDTLDCTKNESLKKIVLAKDQTIPNLSYDEETTVLEYPAPEKKIVQIPDENFKTYMIANFDTDQDGEISEEEALEIKEIKCYNKNIQSLEGIASCVNLEVLFCYHNKLSAIDVSKNVNLVNFDCSNNNLGRIDVSKNVLLEKLLCYSCGLSALNLTSNVALIELNCYNNNLKVLDVSGNVLLQRLFCQENSLATLDLRKNILINALNCQTNPGLNSLYLEENHIIEDLFVDTPPTSIIYSSYVSVKDQIFMKYLLENFDDDQDGRLSVAESKKIKAVDCSNLDISSLEGIGLFTGLTSLVCSGNKLTSLDVSSNTSLVTLMCDSNQLEVLDVSKNTALITLGCSKNLLTSLSLSANEALKTLVCNGNRLFSLEVKYNTKLETLMCQDNYIARVMDLRSNQSLKMMDCRNNPKLAQLYLNTGQTIETLLLDESATMIRYINQVESGIDIKDENFRNYLMKFDANNDGVISSEEAKAVTSIDLSNEVNKDIRTLSGIEHFPNLVYLNCDGCQLTSLSLSNNKALTLLYCSDNQLNDIDVSACTELRQLYCRRNNLSSLNIIRNVKLTYVDCQNNHISKLTIRYNSSLTDLVCYDNPITEIYMTDAQKISVNVRLTGDPSQIIKTPTGDFVFSDVYFEDYLLSRFDTNGDGGISVAEALAVTQMDCSGMNISSFDGPAGSNGKSGIEAFENLTLLNCGNNKLTTLRLNKNKKLSVVYCNDNKLTLIKVDQCTDLSWLYCPGNELVTLDLSLNAALTVLDCTDNKRLNSVTLNPGVSSDIVRKDGHTVIKY